MCAKVAQNHETKEQKAKNPSKVLLSRIFYVPLPDKEPFLRPFGSKRAELERKQAGGSASSGLTIRISRQNTEIRRFPNCNLENCVISQTSDKQRWFEISSKVTKNPAHFSNEREKVSVNDSKEKSQRKIMSGSLIRGQK